LSKSFTVQRRVEFRDTDAAGIVHFSAFFPMMEAAEHEALRSVGICVMQPMSGGGHLTWPRVASHCDYLASARFENLLEIDVRVERIGNTSVTYAFDIRRELTPVARGTITAVCCHWFPDRAMQKVVISQDIRSRLAQLVSA